MPAFIALHIAEHSLSPSSPRTAVKYTKIMVGLPRLYFTLLTPHLVPHFESLSPQILLSSLIKFPHDLLLLVKKVF